MDHIIEKNKRERKGRVYFTKETEAAIVRYNASTDKDERSDIYQDYIHWPFYKLTQNIIHTFKFYYTEVENSENGAKAYSYFGTIVKRWLIVYNTKNYGKKIQNIQITDINNYSNLDKLDPGFVTSQKLEEGMNILTEKEFEGDDLALQGYKHEDKLSLFIDQFVEDAILELFRKRDNIDVFNKKALYIYIREMVDVKTPKITKIANVLYKIFKEKYMFYLEHGYYPPSKD